MAEVLEVVVSRAKELVSALITKPKMSEKLLSKPPFRFLHDTISAIVNTTGFGDGLFQGDELNSAAITDKQSKIAYLEKIFNFVGVCKVSALVKRCGLELDFASGVGRGGNPYHHFEKCLLISAVYYFLYSVSFLLPFHGVLTKFTTLTRSCFSHDF